MVELIVIGALLSLAGAGWSMFILSASAHRQDREFLLGQITRLENFRQKEIDRNNGLAERIVEMRKQDFVEPAPLPVPRPPLPVEIEAFIAELPLEMQGEQRAWCYEQMEAQIPPAEILQELDSAGEMIEDEIRRSEHG